VEVSEAIDVVHKILDFLLSLLNVCKQYIDIASHGTNKLVSYFQVHNAPFYCQLSVF
jgi:hypothetical protein